MIPNCWRSPPALAWRAATRSVVPPPPRRTLACRSKKMFARLAARDLGGTLAGEPVHFGRPELFAAFGVGSPPHDRTGRRCLAGGAAFSAGCCSSIRCAQARPAALEELRGLGLARQILLTGDRALVAHRIGGRSSAFRRSSPRRRRNRNCAGSSKRQRAGQRPAGGDGSMELAFRLR